MKTPLGRRPRVVLVDDDPGLLRLLTIRLRSEGFDVAACASASQALVSVPRFKPDVVVTDLRMKDKDGIALLKDLQARYAALPVILLTAHGTIPDAVTATRSGAFAFLTKPVEKEQLLEQLAQALRVSGYATIHEEWREGIVTRNPTMEERLSKALQTAGTDSPILISGQPGTGKKQLAHAIHKASPRRDQSFLPLACAAVSEQELALLVATEPGGGIDGEPVGTVFLDEIADLELQQQTHLINLIDRPQDQYPRLIASTARDLSAAIARGHFREELFYKLSVVHIDLPPLAQRREDIPLLAVYFLDELAHLSARHVLAPEAVELLISAEWPGNVAQLRNLLRQTATLAAGPVISAELVQQALGGGAASRVPTFDEARDEFTRSYLGQLLQITRGNVTQAAKLAGRNRTDFYKLLGRHQLQPDEYKQR